MVDIKQTPAIGKEIACIIRIYQRNSAGEKEKLLPRKVQVMKKKSKAIFKMPLRSIIWPTNPKEQH